MGWTTMVDRWRKMEPAKRLALLLRIGVAGCFIGHGAFGVIGKEAWLPYFAAVGIGPDLAWTLMPLVGGLDILVGIVVLLRPRPVLLLYATVWATWTALLRPLAGESVFEAFERAGNYGVPLALLALAALGDGRWRTWLAPMKAAPLTMGRLRAVEGILRATTALLLIGHGGLALSGKALLVAHVTTLGLPADAVLFTGAVEVALGVAVAVRPLPRLLMVVLVWKVVTEALYPLTGAPFWEFVERAGSYVAPLALWTLVRRPLAVPRLASTIPVRRVGALVAVLALGLTAATGIEAPPEDDPTLLTRLRSGGLVLACRHAVTDRRRGDRRPVDLSDPSTQRVLSAAGEAQARRLGSTLRRLGIPVGEVWASPYARTADSAELAFGRVRTDPALYWYGGSSGKRDLVRRLLSSRPEEGTNRAIMTHQGVLYGSLTSVERGSLAEGDCVVVLPKGDEGFELLARMSPGDWERLP